MIGTKSLRHTKRQTERSEEKINAKLAQSGTTPVGNQDPILRFS